MKSSFPDLSKPAVSDMDKSILEHTKTRTDKQIGWNKKPESSSPKKNYREHTYATARDSSYPKSSV